MGEIMSYTGNKLIVNATFSARQVYRSPAEAELVEVITLFRQIHHSQIPLFHT